MGRLEALELTRYAKIYHSRLAALSSEDGAVATLRHLASRKATSKANQKQFCFRVLRKMLDIANKRRTRSAYFHKPQGILLAVSLCFLPLAAQSNHTILVLSGGTWHLHSRIPLGSDTLLLRPAHRVVQIGASAEYPELEGWTLTAQHNQPILLDTSGKPVQELPNSISFRVTAKALKKKAEDNPMPVDDPKSLNDFLLDLRFRVQVFRGMKMREIGPSRTSMVGVPADEPSEERTYTASFSLDGVRPDDRIVLLVNDGAGIRLMKFHLEFL